MSKFVEKCRSLSIKNRICFFKNKDEISIIIKIIFYAVTIS